ncbi:MAG TPA: flavin reductase family protein [Thermoplasmata archaeon]|nr:flavin reductase family protein [Thermoplasmata archaeon]
MTASGPPTTPVDPTEFRTLMARWPTGVTVVTARDGAMDAGLTVNAFLSVSLAPPSVLVSLTRDADTTPVIERTGTFAVNFLAADQRALSERFARAVAPAEKFVGIPVHRGVTGVALLDATLGAVECRVGSRVPMHDHVLFVGQVVHQELGREAPPLLFFRSAYAEAEGSDRLHLGTRAQR